MIVPARSTLLPFARVLSAVLLAAPLASAEENLLAPPEGGPADTAASKDSFGAQLGALGLEATWSGYGDLIYWAHPGPATFDSSHFNPVLGASVGRRLHAELELEVEGERIRAEYGFLDLTIARALVVRLGKVLVPLGQFNEVQHPSFRWNMISRPAMFGSVMPAVWSSVGVELRGAAEPAPGFSLSYAAFVVNGLAAASADIGTPGFLRDARENPVDNNSDKMFGGRLAAGIGAGPQSATLGASFASGAIDPAAGRRWSVVDLDLQVRLEPFTLLAEAAQSYLGSDADPLQSFERGAYLLLDYRLGRFHADLRYDFAEESLGGGATRLTRVIAAGALFRPSPLWSVRLEAGFDVNPGTPDRLARVGAMTAFSF